jgi:hypothetical protein
LKAKYKRLSASLLGIEKRIVLVNLKQANCKGGPKREKTANCQMMNNSSRFSLKKKKLSVLKLTITFYFRKLSK